MSSRAIARSKLNVPAHELQTGSERKRTKVRESLPCKNSHLTSTSKEPIHEQKPHPDPSPTHPPPHRCMVNLNHSKNLSCKMSGICSLLQPLLHLHFTKPIPITQTTSLARRATQASLQMMLDLF